MKDLLLRCRQKLKHENFTSSFDRLRQSIAQKSVPHVQHDYFSSFNQSNAEVLKVFMKKYCENISNLLFFSYCLYAKFLISFQQKTPSRIPNVWSNKSCVVRTPLVH